MNDSSTLASFFERVRIFLADGDFAKADEYCERILDIEPTNWEAYYLKFIAALKLRNEEMLNTVTVPFGSVPVYQKVLQYAPTEVLDRLATIETTNYTRLMEPRFKEAQNLEKIAISAFDFAKAAVALEALGTYRNSGERAKACRQKSNQLAAEGHRRVRKGIIIVAIVLVALYVALFTVNAIYQSSPSANFLYAHTPDGITIIQAKNKNVKSLKIPETIDGKPVVSIDDSAFADCDKLKKVTLPNTLVSIGDKAFKNCTKLKEINFPASGSLTTIGDNAFSECDSLETVHLPDSVTALGKNVFYGSECLANVTLPQNITIIPEGTFTECKSLKSITIPESVTEIGNSAFEGCTNLTEVVLFFGLKTIESHAFDGCQRLAKIVIPLTVTRIKEYAFLNCTSLTIHCVATYANYAFDSRWNYLTTDGPRVPTVYDSRG